MDLGELGTISQNMRDPSAQHSPVTKSLKTGGDLCMVTPKLRCHSTCASLWVLLDNGENGRVLYSVRASRPRFFFEDHVSFREASKATVHGGEGRDALAQCAVMLLTAVDGGVPRAICKI